MLMVVFSNHLNSHWTQIKLDGKYDQVNLLNVLKVTNENKLWNSYNKSLANDLRNKIIVTTNIWVRVIGLVRIIKL